MARKPPLNMGCEASTGWFADSSGKPTLILCRKPGVERQDVRVLKWATVLCDECYTAVKQQRGKDDNQSGETGAGTSSPAVR
jgi:hypothetical protein